MAETPTQQNTARIARLEADNALTTARLNAVERAAEKGQEIAAGHSPEIAELRAQVKQLQADRDEFRKQLEDLKNRLWTAGVGLLLALVSALIALVVKK